MTEKYRIDPKLNTHFTVGQLSRGIKNPPFKKNRIHVVNHNTTINIPLAHPDVKSSLLYQTVNTLTRLNLHQTPQLALDAIRVFDYGLYKEYMVAAEKVVGQPDPVFALEKRSYYGLIYSLMKRDIITDRESPRENILTGNFPESIESMVRRGTAFFTQNEFIESNMNFREAFSGYLGGVEGDFLCKNGIYALRTASTDKDFKQPFTHVLIQTLFCKMCQDYKDYEFSKIGIYNPRLNMSYEYSLDDIDEDFIEFIMNIHKKGKAFNERVEILSQ